MPRFSNKAYRNEQGQYNELGELLARIEIDPTGVESFRGWLVAAFYRVSLIGLKLEAFETVVWSTSGRRSVSEAEITPATRISVHPCFWRSLGINPQASGALVSGQVLRQNAQRPLPLGAAFVVERTKLEQISRRLPVRCLAAC